MFDAIEDIPTDDLVREFYHTGITPQEWADTFGEDE